MRSWRSRVAVGLAAGAAVLAVPLTAGAASADPAGTASASASASAADAPQWKLIAADFPSEEVCEASGAEKFVDPTFAEMYSEVECTEQADGKWSQWAFPNL